MQVTARIGAQPDDIACVGRYLRLVQHHVEHGALALNSQSNAHAATDAEGRKTFMGIATHHFVQQ